MDSIENQEMEIEDIGVGDQQADIHLYLIELHLQTREFKGQTSGLTKSALQIECDSVPEFKHLLWVKIKDKLKREVIVDDNDLRWHESLSPQEEDLERFILFYDTKAKRSVTLDKVNTVTLNHWRSKEIWMYVHIYSTAVANLSLWKKVQKNLIEPVTRDRAGATSIAETNALVLRLKDIHKLHYQSNHINWIMWANRIHAAEPHQREKLVNSPPPPEMVHLFAVARTSADDTVSGFRQNLSVAEEVNEGSRSGLTRIRTLIEDIIKIQNSITELRNEEKAKTEQLNLELRMMETQAVTTRSLITSMEHGLPAIVTDFGRQAFSQIQDQEDVDHIEHEG